MDTNSNDLPPPPPGRGRAALGVGFLVFFIVVGIAGVPWRGKATGDGAEAGGCGGPIDEVAEAESEARARYNSVAAKYRSLGGHGSFLGRPVIAERSAPDGVGRYRHYQRGSIYHHPDTAAWEIHGAIRARWGQLRWERGFLGYPITDELPTRGRVGRFNHFQHGSLYWKPNLGALFLRGKIRVHWAFSGAETNPALGYPVSDQLYANGRSSRDRYQSFENGVIFYNGSTRQTQTLVANPLLSQNAQSMFTSITDAIRAEIVQEDAVSSLRGPTVTGVQDYFVNNGIVSQRRYNVTLNFKADVPGKNPKVTIDQTIAIGYDKRTRELYSFLAKWRLHVRAYSTSLRYAVNKVESETKKTLNAQLGVRQTVLTLPPNINVLSYKVMADGALNAYLRP